MSKINLRSPFIVSANDANLEVLKLELFAYSGIQNTDRGAAKYVLTTDSEFIFDISELAREYLDISFDGVYLPQNIWVDYRLTKTISGVETVGDYVNLEGFYGYGYFEDGINPQNDSNILQSNNTVYKLDSDTIIVAVNKTNLLSITSYFSNGTSSTFTFADNGAELDYLFQDENEFLFQDGLTFLFADSLSEMSIYYLTISEFSNVVKLDFNYTESVVDTVFVKIIDECKYEPKKITFINKFGVLQDIWFFKNSTVSLTTTEESYKNNLLNFNTYSTTTHENQTLNKQGTEKISLNSGYYPEDFNEVFKQLFLSEKVWISEDGMAIPVNVSSSNLTLKNRLYDKLINYTIDFDYAFDAINKIR